jgi:hypothetical protein
LYHIRANLGKGFRENIAKVLPGGRGEKTSSRSDEERDGEKSKTLWTFGKMYDTMGKEGPLSRSAERGAAGF